MLVYRLCKRTYLTEPLSAEGARRAGGRWNPKGYPILYTSSTPELALLEVLVHLNPSYVPAFHLLVLNIPPPDRILTPSDLPLDWLADESYEPMQNHLLDWLQAPDALSVSVPSSIVVRSRNVLLHTQYPGFKDTVRVIEMEPFPIDPRVLDGAFR